MVKLSAPAPAVVAAIAGNVRFAPALVRVPWLTTLAAAGSRMYQAAPSTGCPAAVAAVPSVTQSCPFANETPPTRESLPSRTFSLTCARPLNRPTACQHGTPVAGMSCWLPTQVASGTGPGFWLGAAGTAYGRTSTVAVVSARFGEDVLRMLVFLSFWTTSDDDVPLSVNTARELARYSVPPFAEANCVPGLTAGIA